MPGKIRKWFGLLKPKQKPVMWQRMKAKFRTLKGELKQAWELLKMDMPDEYTEMRKAAQAEETAKKFRGAKGRVAAELRVFISRAEKIETSIERASNLGLWIHLKKKPIYLQ